MNVTARLEGVRRRLADAELDAILVTGVENVRYLTGFGEVFADDPAAALIVAHDAARLYTDFRYEEAVKVAAADSVWDVRIQRESLYVELCEDLRADGVGSLALESGVPYGRFRFVSEQFGGCVEAVDQWIEDLRQIKDEAEIELIASAQALADRALEHVLPMVAAGVTERALGLELEWFLRRNGSEGVAFAPIVASGPNSARPHATVSDRVLEQGDLLTMDFGARVGGYRSDMTRTFVVGAASERQRELYEAVLAANVASVAACRAGIGCRDLDSVAREVLAERGLAEVFGHGLGHGVGLAVHEAPTVSQRSDATLRAGVVVTIEPGAYVSGFGGVRIEDLVVVEDGGCRVLSRSAKELREL